jgi:hypothetical protein
MSDTRSEPETSAPRPQAAKGDRLLIGAGLVGVSLLAAVLWSQAGREVFASAMAGLWALCF